MGSFYAIIQITVTLNGQPTMVDYYDSHHITTPHVSRYTSLDKCENALLKLMESRYKIVKFENSDRIVLTQLEPNYKSFTNLQCVNIF